jgi:DNA-binding MurR/RpiR family transcriptional regulator
MAGYDTRRSRVSNGGDDAARESAQGLREVQERLRCQARGSPGSVRSARAPAPPNPGSEGGELLSDAQDALRQAAAAIGRLADALPAKFLTAAEMLRDCKGMVVVTGMGKAGLIGEKVSATLASTGTRSMFLHPADAVHGDLGRIYHEDVVLAFSASGATQEMLRLLDPLRSIGARLVHTGQSGARSAATPTSSAVGKVVRRARSGSRRPPRRR